MTPLSRSHSRAAPTAQLGQGATRQAPASRAAQRYAHRAVSVPRTQLREGDPNGQASTSGSRTRTGRSPTRPCFTRPCRTGAPATRSRSAARELSPSFERGAEQYGDAAHERRAETRLSHRARSCNRAIPEVRCCTARPTILSLLKLHGTSANEFTVLVGLQWTTEPPVKVLRGSFSYARPVRARQTSGLGPSSEGPLSFQRERPAARP